MIDSHRLLSAYTTARQDLLDARNGEGFWEGCLASSALSTATAISALSIQAKHSSTATTFQKLIPCAIDWLSRNQNPDGGWGDTDKSNSNISTTMLVSAAFEICGESDRFESQLSRAAKYIEQQGGIQGLKRRYGKDKTFAVPILTNCALAGQVSWREVSALPFELACFPQSFYRFLRLPVVSYAIPALVAIGQAVYHHNKPWNPISRMIRNLAKQPSLEVLQRIQPSSGGYLEAIPLTSFVCMSLASIGEANHPVVQNGLRFLIESVREDGSWPIDTNLSTWNTTLSINSLSHEQNAVPEEIDDVLDWVLGCQNRDVHPFTGADPGGWGWSDLSGAVPDADDTPSALLALRNYYDSSRLDNVGRAKVVNAVSSGLGWLLDLQNRDGGWPTFCRGWGKLPFDRSGTDLTAHAIRALNAWPTIEDSNRVHAAIERGFRYLQQTQLEDGSWLPLWFGNQAEVDEENPIYGTSKVLLAYSATNRLRTEEARRAKNWLIKKQNGDGGWGGEADTRIFSSQNDSSVEETALAVEALLSFNTKEYKEYEDELNRSVQTGIEWLINSVDHGKHTNPWPIGFYFAKLWYYEELYPLIFTVSALGKAVAKTGSAAVSASENLLPVRN